MGSAPVRPSRARIPLEPILMESHGDVQMVVTDAPAEMDKLVLRGGCVLKVPRALQIVHVLVNSTLFVERIRSNMQTNVWPCVMVRIVSVREVARVQKRKATRRRMEWV